MCVPNLILSGHWRDLKQGVVVLVGQKKEIKRQKERIELLRREEAEERERVRDAARQRVLQDFERGQLGLGGTRVVDKDFTPPDECKSFPIPARISYDCFAISPWHETQIRL